LQNLSPASWLSPYSAEPFTSTVRPLGREITKGKKGEENETYFAI
jgi:hypothetical protein